MGVDHAVSVTAPAAIHGISIFGGGITRFSGCPESMRVISGSGPFGPIFRGVWQSLQPTIVTRYFPRSARETLPAFAVLSVPFASASDFGLHPVSVVKYTKVAQVHARRSTRWILVVRMFIAK